ncbi:MAG TPA: DNA-processing protein DprA [Candidatus Polarisedimenticolia bacterium]|nr:DNA-processing protein DprA [Candidatus Polarisedimenticolia bacterium]
MAPDLLRACVGLGLAFSVHPRWRRSITGSEGWAEWIEAFPDRLGELIALRCPGSGDIFRADYPDRADREIEASRRAGALIVTFRDAAYPKALLRLPDAPPCLYVRGSFEPEDRLAVAVVGSRRATPYGLRIAEELGHGLSCAGLTVVSGLARGVDSAAHRGALSVGGRTIGVLGSGIDIVYPIENRGLFAAAARSGAVMTEHPFGTRPLRAHFPQRNRLIAGMGLAVVVVEAAPNSGSLITAGYALETLGLPVCAVPGSIVSRTSEGCNNLIYEGAVPVRNVGDILAELRAADRKKLTPRRGPGPAPKSAAARAGQGLDPGARRVLDALRPLEAVSADRLAGATKLASGVLLGHLLDLEIRGLVHRMPGGLYMRKH